jgi:hypothetical protein
VTTVHFREVGFEPNRGYDPRAWLVQNKYVRQLAEVPRVGQLVTGLSGDELHRAVEVLYVAFERTRSNRIIVYVERLP